MKIIPTLLAATLLLVSCNQDATDNEEIIQVDSGDSEMNIAIEQARKTVDKFLERWTEAPEDFNGLLKVYFKDGTESDEDGEHMWIRMTEAQDGQFAGVLLSSPGWLKSVKQGDVVRFARSDISDWLYAEDGKAVGAYTVQLLRSRMSSEERESHDANYPFSFD